MTRSPIIQLHPITRPTSVMAQPRARGEVKLVVKPSDGRSVVDTLYQSGSARCLFPRGRGQGLDAVFVNTAGGVTGGDRMAISATAKAGTTVTVTTQACERAYKAQPGQVGRVRNVLRAETGARINWMPQETILFDGAAIDRRLRVDLAEDARLLMVEPLIFGRAAMGERVTGAFFKDRIDIRRDGGPLYLDAMRLSGDVDAHLAKPHIAAGAGAMASIVYVDPGAAGYLDPVRDMLPETAGASLLADDTLVLRLLAPDGFALRQTLVPLLRLLNTDEFPRSWMI